VKALVTGGCGFIGSNLVRALLEDNWEVEIVDDLSSGDMGLLNGINFRTIPAQMAHLYSKEKDTRAPELLVIVGDFVHDAIIQRIIEGNYDIVFHAAANPRVEYSVQNPLQTTDNNFMKSVKLMTHCIDNIKRFVFSSSSAVYGDVESLPTPENESLNPKSPYALQKLNTEEYGRLYSQLYNLDFVSLRYFNVYGPGQYGDSPYATAIAAWCDKVANGDPLRSDGDGTQSRDLIFVEDIAQANIEAATYEGTFKGEAFNVGTGSRITNNEVLDLFREKFLNVKTKNAPWRQGDVLHTQADVSAAKDTFGFSARTNIHAGLEKTFEWWRLNE
tara:strand:+ start:514 stop:1506 length:993 start_codon:yes stop_codon:yes gene_type:complete